MSGDEAQSVAENRKNSDVSFTANSFSIWVVAGSGSKYVTDETVYLKVKETKTLSAGSFEYNNNWTTSNKNIVEINGTGDSITIKGVRQGTAVITHEYKNGLGKKVKETTTIKVTSDDKQAVVAYFYVLLPEREIGSTKAGDYFYVGQGSVIPYDGDTQRSDLVQHQGTSNVVTYPDKEQVLQAVKQRYGSDIEVEDVIWYKTPWADGANSNTDKPLVNAGTKCYHVDGYVTYSTVNYTTVAFKAVPPGAGADADESNFELVDYYNKVKLLNGKATVTPTTKSATSINGYVFEGWYSDKACTQKVTDWTINGPTTYYGHYVPNMDDTRELKYQVVYQTEEGTILDTVTEKVNIWVEADSYIVEKVESKTFTGYKQKDDSPKLPQEVKDNDKVIVLYEADKNAKVEVKYTVQHWVAGVHQSDDDVEVTDKVWVNDAKELTVTADSLAQNNYTGYTFDNYNPADIKEGMTVSDGDVIKVNYLENEVTINYIADANGNVSNTSETILAVNGTATGSTATADTGYHFVNWTNEEGTVVSTDETYIPERVNELYAAATYTAHFEADVVTPPAPTPTPDEPTETTPTGTTPTVTAPTEATAVLGEAFAPVQPEVGVLGEAAAPEVGVLGEAKGPGTGDTAPIAAWSLIIVGAILTLGISAKKRKKEEQ